MRRFFLSRYGLFLLGFICLASPIQAQVEDVCDLIIQDALSITNEICSAIGRNEICYGSVMVVIEPHLESTQLEFTDPGDIAEVTQVHTLQFSPFNEETQEWGMALMRLQANLPDTSPGQNVNLLAFGDVFIEDNAPLFTEIAVTVKADSIINVRAEPSTSATTVDGLDPDEEVIVNGRTKANDWLHIAGISETSGWVFADLLSTQGDLSELTVMDQDESIVKPMQAFVFRSGIGDAPCQEAPDSGILIQTPQGVATIQFQVNGVDIELGSTIYIQAQKNESLIIYVLEGQIDVSAFDETVVVPAGAYATVPLGDDLYAVGPPESAQPYESDRLAPLQPIINIMPDSPTIAAPLDPESIEELMREQETCRISSDKNPNIRSGPGTDYSVVTHLSDEDVEPLGQAVGTDDFIWYQTGSQKWVRSDTVDLRGNCDALPFIQDIPTPIPVSNVSQPATEPTNNNPVQISVPGISTSWTSSGINLQTGQRYTLSAYGTVQYGPEPQHVAGPNGNPSWGGDYSGHAVKSGVLDIALAGRIGDGPGFFVGTGGTFVADRNGLLQFIVNDNQFDDNSGEFIVVIQLLD